LDQVTVRGVYTQEANAEAERILSSKTNIFTIMGKNNRSINKDAIQTAHAFTKMISESKPNKSLDQRFYLKSRFIQKQEEIDRILNIKESDITKSLLLSLFAHTPEGEPPFQPWDTFKLPVNNLFNKSEELTTIGRYLFNKFVYYNMLPLIGYVNETVTGKTLEKYDEIINNAVFLDKLSTDIYIDYLDRLYWFCLAPTAFITTSLSYDVFVPLDKVMSRKEELIAEHSESISKGDAFVVSKIEKELLDLSKDELSGHASMDNFDNGVGKFGNAYKNMSIMRGTIADLAHPGQYNVATESYIEGFSKTNFPYFVNMNINGAYSKAVGTRVGGLTSFRLTLINLFNCWNNFIIC